LFILAEWNYYESDNSLILYWPSKYDFLSAFLLKLINKPYHAEILKEVYFWRKGGKQPIFQRVQVTSDCEYSPRIGCSSYQFQDKIYIFGGFYEKEKNYLELQHDIITFDLSQLEITQKNHIHLQNIKHRLYSE
jgi:hypothetical protein